MAMRAHPRCVVHSHYSPVPIDLTERLRPGDSEVGRLTGGTYARSIEPPYESGTFKFKCAYEEINAIVNTGDWVVFYDAADYPLSLLHVDTVDYDVDTSDAGSVSCAGVFTASSWMMLLAKAHLYAPMGMSPSQASVGTVFNKTDWSLVALPTLVEFFAQPLGKSLQEFHKMVAKIRLPPSLGGGFLGDDIPVVYNDETRQLYAPDREIDEVTRSRGGPSGFPWNFPHTSPTELYQQLWVPESNLIELYPSIEQGGTAPPSPLAAAINGRPVLVYTLKPWRAQPLKEAVTTYTSFKLADDAANTWRNHLTNPKAGTRNEALTELGMAGIGRDVSKVSDATYAAQQSKALAEAQKKGTQAETAAAKQAYALSNMFTKTTRKLAPYGRKHIPADNIRSIKMRYSDDARVNVATISVAPGGGTGPEALEFAGLPIISDDSVLDHGARVMKPVWPFFPDNDWENDGDLINYAYGVAAQVMQFHVNSHRLASGTIITDALDAIVDQGWADQPQDVKNGRARYIHLQAGEWFTLDVHAEAKVFAAYAETVTHNWAVDQRGAVTYATQIEYSRGSAADDELTAFGKVPVKEDRQPTQRTLRIAGSTTPEPSTNYPVTYGDHPPEATRRLTRSILMDGKEYALVTTPNNFTVYRQLIGIPREPTWLAQNRVNGGTLLAPAGGRGVTLPPINNIFVHYNDGSLTATNSRLRTVFQEALNTGKPDVIKSSHFSIDADGEVLQMLDLAYTGFHTYSSGLNPNVRSIGIDLIVPYSQSRKPGNAAALNGTPPPRGWRKMEGWRIYPAAASLRVPDAVDPFLGPSLKQVDALTTLLANLHKLFGFPLTTASAPGDAKSIRRFTATEKPIRLAGGGVWHHLQFENNRSDSNGTDLPAIVAAAKTR